MNRRSFLKNASVFSLPVFFGGFQAAAFPSPIMRSLTNNESDKVLVLIDLNGGNDGLNTFIPLDWYDNLARARPDVVIPEKYTLSMTDTIAMHPKMNGMKRLYEQGNLTLIQGVAYPNQNRSHFRSADIWNTAVKSDEYASTGWVGRYMDEEFPGYPENYPNSDHTDPFAITMGRSNSGTCQGMNSTFSMAIIDTEDVGGLSTGIEPSLPNDYYGEELGFLIETFKKTNAYADRVTNAAWAGASKVSYPNTELGRQLKTVARLISGGLETKVYVLKIGGFDTHANQVEESSPIAGKHATLLERISDAIAAFQQDLDLLDLDKRVLGMTFSEFGRKIKSNAGFGTDHGTAAPMIVFGSCINPGVIGDNPIIPSKVDANEGVAMQFDFKSVYGSILMDWFGATEDQIHRHLIEDFQHLPIVGDCALVSPLADVAAKAYPNPFTDSFVLGFNTFNTSKVSIEIFDVMGKVLQKVPVEEYPTGGHSIRLGSNLPAGSYFIRVRIGNGVKTLRVVKA